MSEYKVKKEIARIYELCMKGVNLNKKDLEFLYGIDGLIFSYGLDFDKKSY